MKVIISHDVDHHTVTEHLKDGLLFKFWLRFSYELLCGSTKLSNYISMLGEIKANRWNYVDELIQFDQNHQIPSTFFVGVNNGLGLSYSMSSAASCIMRINQEGFEVGVHGICYDDLNGIKDEYARFRTISGLSYFGIRMHYLRADTNTLANLAIAGYSYDTSIYQLAGPQSINGFVEFPLHLMDARILRQDQKYKTVSLKQAQEFSCRIIDQVALTNLPYLTILFHDRYFCNAFSKWKEWYIWIIEYLKSQGLEFINYKNACLEVT